MIGMLGLDADDTLWHNERFFQISQARFAELLADYAAPDNLAERLLEAEHRNLGRYGYGVKAFVLSMIETALDVTERKVPGTVVAQLIEAGHEMLEHPIDLLPGVEETVASLSGQAPLVLITKGDLLDQERKLAQSGLGDHFDAVEVVSEKTPETYARLFERHARDGVSVMVGNSVKSDVIAPIEAGGWGIYVPSELTWSLEAAAPPTAHPRFRKIDGFKDLPATLDGLF